MGSFVNAVVWRLHEQSNEIRVKSQEKKTRKTHNSYLLTRYSILRGRSMCPHCRHELAALDLVPVLSWLFLKGKCRYCAKPISWQYPLVELLTAGLFVVSYLYWPYGLFGVGLVQLIIWLAVVVLLVALLAYDLKWMILPNKLMFPLIILSAVSTLVSFSFSTSSLAALAGSVAVGAGLFYALFQLSDGKWIGGGDVKLGFAYGLLLASPLKSAAVLFLASVLGTILVLPSLLTKKTSLQSKIPFGPLLIIATIVVYLFSDSFLNYFKTKFYL